MQTPCTNNCRIVIGLRRSFRKWFFDVDIMCRVRKTILMMCALCGENPNVNDDGRSRCGE